MGARRCIYCGADVSHLGGEDSSAGRAPEGRAGVRIPDHASSAPVNQTLFGVPSRNTRGSAPDPGPGPGRQRGANRPATGIRRNATSRRGERDNPRASSIAAPSSNMRHTLMGLGSVKLLHDVEEGGAPAPAPAPDPRQERANPRSAESRNPSAAGAIDLGSTMAGRPIGPGSAKPNLNATMAGLPSVSTDDVAEHRTRRSGIRASSPQRPEPQREPVGNHTMFGMRAVSTQPGSFPNFHDPEPEPDTPSIKTPPRGTPSHDFRDRAPTTLAPTEAQAQAEDDFDPLAGMDGVQQAQPSSLMDEEVDNLASMVFGDGGFDFDDEDFDDEWDDDFDEAFDAAYQASAPKPPEPQPSAQSREDDVFFDHQAAQDGLFGMMAELEDFMPSEDEAAAAFGLDNIPEGSSGKVEVKIGMASTQLDVDEGHNPDLDAVPDIFGSDDDYNVDLEVVPDIFGGDLEITSDAPVEPTPEPARPAATARPEPIQPAATARPASKPAAPVAEPAPVADDSAARARQQAADAARALAKDPAPEPPRPAIDEPSPVQEPPSSSGLKVAIIVLIVLALAAAAYVILMR